MDNIIHWICNNSDYVFFIFLVILTTIGGVWGALDDYKRSCGEIKMIDKTTLDAFGEFYEVVNGEYIPVCKASNIKTTLIEEPDVTMSATINEPITFTLEGTITGKFNNEVLFDLVAPVHCNCRNCGAPVRLNYCEYCGTQYPPNLQGRFKIGE